MAARARTRITGLVQLMHPLVTFFFWLLTVLVAFGIGLGFGYVKGRIDELKDDK